MTNRINNYLFKVIAYKKAFTPEECEKIKQTKSGFDIPMPVYFANNNPSNNPPLHPETKGFQFNDETKWIFDRLHKITQNANDNFFHFDVNGFADLRLNKYDQNHFFDWHPDLGTHQTSTRKITIVVLLSDQKDYKGGELQWEKSKDEIDQDQGTVVLFPPYMFHRVTPITEGHRYSLVCWAVGPHFK